MKTGFVEIIFYVKDQQLSRDFYKTLLGQNPILDVAGMTEFLLNHNCKLGLMPEDRIVKILEDKVPDPASGNGIPRCELYLYTDDPGAYVKRAINLGAKLVSETSERNWGDLVGYCADPDGHILAFAKSLKQL